jgi:dTDP-4-amino-4,6-dideoxygalactose transaminase
MKVPMLDIARQHEPILDELKAAFSEALSTSRFIKGPELEALESEFAAYCHTRRAVGCASGTDALILALQAVGLREGDVAVTTPFSFFASAGAIVRAGGVPAFVDIRGDTFNMDPRELESWLNRNCASTDRGVVHRAMKTRVAAVIPVHLFGQTADMDEIMRIARRWGLPVVEDACQSIGASWKGAPAGSLGDVGCFSFFPSKNLGALGDGGMLSTNDPELADRLLLLREHGGQGYIHSTVGTNSRLDALQAAFLRIKLRRLDNWHEGRRKNAGVYDEAFRGMEGVKTPVVIPGAESVFNQYTIRTENRDGLLAHLKSLDIGCAVYYPLCLHLQKCFDCLGYRIGDFPVAEACSADVISLPVFAELSEAEIETVISAVKGFHGQNAQQGQ